MSGRAGGEAKETLAIVYFDEDKPSPLAIDIDGTILFSLSLVLFCAAIYSIAKK